MKKSVLNISFFALVIASLVFIYGSMDIKENKAVTQVKEKQETIVPVQKLDVMINESKAKYSFNKINLFEIQSIPFTKNDINRDIKKAANLKIDKTALSDLFRNKNPYITLTLPVDSKNSLTLELKEVQLLSDDFKLASGTSGVQSFNKGIYYRGIVNGEENSIAAISIFENLVMGVVSSEAGTFNIGPVNDNSNNTNYIIYNEKDLLVDNEFICKVDGLDMHLYKTDDNHSSHKETGDAITARLPVKIYIEADYKLYQDKGSDINAVGNFVSGFYNSVAAIYQNEFIPVQISSIVVWDTPDPYRFLSDSYDYLLKFGGNKRDNFNGDLAQLLSSRTLNLGGIAWIGMLCGSFNTQDSSGRFSFCNIDPTYYSYPTYSWTVMVATHELGHNFGSMHTHACWWPTRINAITSIDSCYFAEGNCFSGTRPATGTIMSYCHLQEANGGSIDPRLGFGSMPGDTIRLRYNQCSKFGGVINSSEVPTVFALMQNFPNPFNPTTTIRVALPENSSVTLKVYDINGREVATLLNNESYSTGVLNYVFNSGAYNLSSGVYFYKVFASDQSTRALKFTEVKRMILLK
ncbi:MAG: M12 family metallo-peptidase [Candidatus Kapaibacterium sp.]